MFVNSLFRARNLTEREEYGERPLFTMFDLSLYYVALNGEPALSVATAAGVHLASQSAPGVEAGRAAGGQGSGQRREPHERAGEHEGI